MPADELMAMTHPLNWRGHPQTQAKALSGMLDKVGWVQDVIVNRTTGRLLDGHLRVELAAKRGAKTPLPVKWVELEEEEERAVLATLDPIGAMAIADVDVLKTLVSKITDADLMGVVADVAETLGIRLRDDGKPMEDPGAQIDKAEELREKWGVESGQLWELGEHRLICGDCTDAAVVARVMGEEKAQLVVTSPPYAVGKEYEAETSFTEHLALLRGMADRCLETVVPGGFVFVNFGEIAPQSHAGPLTGSSRQCIYPISMDYWRIFHEERHCDLYAQRIWYKPFNRLQQPFWSYKTGIPHHQEWEYLWTWKLPDGTEEGPDDWEHIWTWRVPGGNGDQAYNWRISVRAVWDTRNEATDDRPLTRHTAAFPVCLPERAIRSHCAVGSVVWEPFSGSGTTLIACERFWRKCRAVEISPAYCAVAIERWAVMTGRTPRMMSDGRT